MTKKYGMVFLAVLFLGCGGQQKLPVHRYYDYDRQLPLQDSLRLLTEGDKTRLYYLTYCSVHDNRVTALYGVPKPESQRRPAIIFLHGIGDSKAKDYMEYGYRQFVDSGYVVLRIDIANHGDRKLHAYKYDFVKGLKYWTRDQLIQTVFDLRRAVDFLSTRTEVDSQRIGFYGISLGGVIGGVFCGVEPRIKAPVLALAGGGLHLALGWQAFSEEAQSYFSIIDPINYVERIAPPITTRNLFNKAGDPKHIIWYPTTHRRIPQDQAFREGVRWFRKYL